LRRTTPKQSPTFPLSTQGLEELGWTDTRNVRLEIRWAAINLDRLQMFAKELVGLQPDVLSG
jgi:putative ABC transport system substrate-binding protein